MQNQIMLITTVTAYAVFGATFAELRNKQTNNGWLKLACITSACAGLAGYVTLFHNIT